MKTQTKLATLLLTLPMAYADSSLTGSVNTINTLTEPAVSGELFANEIFNAATIQTNVSNNNSLGWEITAYSDHGSVMIHSGDGTGDGDTVAYTLNCSADGATSAGAISVGTFGAEVSMISIDTPIEATVALPVSCTFGPAVGEDLTKQFAGNYDDTIYLTLADQNE